MKKSYCPPTAENISFNYRDQVVAASGGELLGTNEVTGYNNTLLNGCIPSDQIGDYIRNTEAWNICDLWNT